MNERVRMTAWLLWLALGPACSELPSVPSGVCGNGVVEAGEDCDTFAPDATSMCRPAGSVHACHLDCRRDSAGSRAACPSGWGCDDEGVCRAPTGEFEAPVDYPIGGAASLQAGDFDGDGRADLISRHPPDVYGRSPLSLHYFDEAGVLVETRSFPKGVGTPALTDLSGDGRLDLAFSDFQVGVLLGRADRSLVPETFSSYLVPETGLRMVGVSRDRVQESSPLVVLTTVDGTPGLYIPSNVTGRLARLGPLDGPVEDLVGNPETGDIVEGADSPCAEVVFAYAGARSFSVADVCVRGEGVELLWRDPAALERVALEPPGRIDTAPVVVDLDLDGHLDVLVGAGGSTYAAYGDGHGLGTALPYSFPVASLGPDGGELPMPLLASEFSGDDAVDFVLPSALLVSVPTPGDPVPTYLPFYENETAAWTLARVGDVNGNGFPDVVAATETGRGVDVFSGTGGRFLIPTRLPTGGSVEHLRLGDFDGDLIEDIAFIQTSETPSQPDTLMVAFGQPDKAPEQPVPVAHVRDAEQLTTYEEVGYSNLIVASREVSGGKERGRLTLLNGSPDRVPFAPHTLVSFSDDGVLADSAALTLSAGHYTKRGHGDVIALGTHNAAELEFELWFIADIESLDTTPTRLTTRLDPKLTPIVRLEDGVMRINAAATSADFDGDGLDEVAWALSTTSFSGCGLALFDVVTRGDRIEGKAQRTAVLDEPCIEPQLEAADADADGALDLVVLTGAPRGEDRKVFVFWNDGKGHFAADRRTMVSTKGDNPQAFAALPATSVREFSIVYVTHEAAKLVPRASKARAFAVPRRLTELERGTAVAAADLDGDGVVDLALLDAGDLRVLKGGLKAP